MKKYRSVSFLVELLINVLVFSICCAILVALFGRAWQVTAVTRQAAAAEAEVNTLVEIAKVRGRGGLLQAGGHENGPEEVCFAYNGDWQPLAAEWTQALSVFPVPLEAWAREGHAVALWLRPEATGAGTLYRLEASAVDDTGSEIYAVQTAFYVPA